MAKLGRDVALKVLPEAFARNAERMVRFQREARVLASCEGCGGRGFDASARPACAFSFARRVYAEAIRL
ncbi:MAG: hypothetical protein ABR953_15135 [Candidatus Acidiferrales bacterium]|jgi:hypothetical protein